MIAAVVTQYLDPLLHVDIPILKFYFHLLARIFVYRETPLHQLFDKGRQMLDSFPLLTSFQNDSLASSKGEKHFCHCGLMNLTIFVFSLLQFLSFLMLELSHPLAIGSSSSLLPNLLDMTLVIFDRNLPSELKYDLNRQNGP